MQKETAFYLLKRWGVPILLLLFFVLASVRLNQTEKVPLVSRAGQTFEKGIVTQILQDNLQPDGSRVGQQTVVVKMLTGERTGEEITMTSASGYLFGAGCSVGMRVVVIQSISGNSVVSSVYSQDREGVIYLFSALYLLSLCLVGGKQGVKAALGLVFTAASILFIYLPLVYRGYSPFWVAVLVCAAATAVTFYLICGPSRKMAAATSGTISGVVFAGIAATVFSAATGVSGWNVSNIESLMVLWESGDIQVGGLLFSGLLISSLGAVMDVSMSISSSMHEFCIQNPLISRKELFHAGMQVGRDMMGTDSNTLILAFAGTSISMLLLDYAYDLSFLQIINSNNIVISIMLGLSGSFGIIFSVPATVAIAALVYRGSKLAKHSAAGAE